MSRSSRRTSGTSSRLTKLYVTVVILSLRRENPISLEGRDEAWPLERIIERVRTLKPRFLPGQPGKVHYSDTNYELLGRIIETVTGKPVADVSRELIFDPLDLRDTYAFTDPDDASPAPMYYKDKLTHLPRYNASITPEGGIVSTAPEVMVFLKAFFTGTVNQLSGFGHGSAVKAMVRIMKAVR